jgi:geranylgeranyl pyrophosphate synthase
MRYAVLSGGKRLRPALTYAAAVAAGGLPNVATPVASAVELVHAYSLVHDDLPAMDDDAERRGRPTVHIKFGEATAVLAGDALLSEAFAQLGRVGVPLGATARLAACSGSRALVGGQVDDLAFRASNADLTQIESIHLRKTAALFRFAVWGGGAAADAGAEDLHALDAFGRAYGLAFQTVDDLLDGERDECSVLCVLEPERARERARAGIEEASSAADHFGETGWALRGLAKGLEARLP